VAGLDSAGWAQTTLDKYAVNVEAFSFVLETEAMFSRPALSILFMTGAIAEMPLPRCRAEMPFMA
jgi:hypothetical protein